MKCGRGRGRPLNSKNKKRGDRKFVNVFQQEMKIARFDLIYFNGEKVVWIKNKIKISDSSDSTKKAIENFMNRDRQTKKENLTFLEAPKSICSHMSQKNRGSSWSASTENSGEMSF